MARNKIYGEDIVSETPEVNFITREERNIIIRLTNVCDELILKGKKINGLQVFVDKIEVRFAWTPYVEVNLFSRTSLLVKPFCVCCQTKYQEGSDMPLEKLTEYRGLNHSRKTSMNTETINFDMDGLAILPDRYMDKYFRHRFCDTSEYKNRGGKLIMYSGSADPLVPYQDALSYYERVIENQKGLDKAMEFIRYFIIPGMSHGNDGPGAQYAACILEGVQKEPLDAVTAWREWGEVPDMLFAVRQHGDENDFCRPIYPYPKKAVCSSADSFCCLSETGERGKVEKIAQRYLKD